MGNLDTALSTLAAEVTTLAAEINALEAEYVAGKKSKQVEMGHKLIALRAILREINGETKNCALDATGQHPPNGWRQWVKENLTISHQHASVCMLHAVDPEGRSAKSRAKARKEYTTDPCRKIQIYLSTRLPHCTQDEKERILNTVYNSFKKTEAA